MQPACEELLVSLEWF